MNIEMNRKNVSIFFKFQKINKGFFFFFQITRELCRLKWLGIKNLHLNLYNMSQLAKRKNRTNLI